MQNDEQQIRELVSTWMSATKAGDSDTVLSLMADDAMFLVAGHPPFGKEAFAAAAANVGNENVQIDGHSEILEVTVVGELAFMVAKLTVTTKQPGARSIVRSGHTLSILTKRSGRWQLHRDANLLVPVDRQGGDT
jgi:uncharacterized protein (TIGR02246 family)